MNGVLIFLAIVIVIALIAWQYYTNAQRRKELSEWAVSKNLQFDPSKDDEMESQFPGFDCLSQGHSQYGYNFISGTWQGRKFLGFDYHYTTGSGKSRSDHYFSAVILTSSVPLKPLSIRPEGVFDKVTEFLGFHDIDFESTEFSNEFYVKAPDKRWAYDVLHQRTIEFLLNSPRFAIQFDESHVIAHNDNTFAPEEFAAANEVIQGILDRLPDYVIKQQLGQT